MATLKELQKELAPHKGKLVLNHFDVVRLIDVVDGKDDYYWVIKHADKRGIHWSSCVGGWMPLKGKISDKHYNELERVWKLNEKNWDYFNKIEKQQRKVIYEWIKDKYPTFGSVKKRGYVSDWWMWDGRTLLLVINDGKKKMYTSMQLTKMIKNFPEVKWA